MQIATKSSYSTFSMLCISVYTYVCMRVQYNFIKIDFPGPITFSSAKLKSKNRDTIFTSHLNICGIIN